MGVDGDEWLPGGGSLRSKIKNCSSNGDIQQWYPLLRTFQRSEGVRLHGISGMEYEQWYRFCRLVSFLFETVVKASF